MKNTLKTYWIERNKRINACDVYLHFFMVISLHSRSLIISAHLLWISL